MPSTLDLRRRIKSVKNTSQITKAMQMVASSKMRRAQERVQQSRPYADQLRGLVSRLARVTGEDAGGEIALLKERPVRRIGRMMNTYAAIRPLTVKKICQAHAQAHCQVGIGVGPCGDGRAWPCTSQEAQQ